MAEYLLVMADRPTGLPYVCGCLIVEGHGPGFSGEAAIAVDNPWDAAVPVQATELLRSLPDPGDADATRWLHGLDGMTNGRVRLVGPWTWIAEPREVLHWTIDQTGSAARTVALIRDGKVIDFPQAGDEP